MKRIALLAAATLPLVAACTSVLGDFSQGPEESKKDGGGAHDDASAGHHDASTGGGKDAAEDGATRRDGEAEGGKRKMDAGPEEDAEPEEGGEPEDSSEPSDAGEVTSVLVKVTGGTTVYVNDAVTAKATATTTPAGANVAFSWSVSSAPTGSTVTTASLKGADKAALTLTPDLAGAYVLTVKGTAPDGIFDKEDVTVSAVSPTVFYMQGTLNTGEKTFDSAYYASGADGTNAHAVTCPLTLPTTNSCSFLCFGATPPEDQFFSETGYTDYWEAPAGQPSLFAVAVFASGDGGTAALFLGQDTDTCTKPPVEIDWDGGATQPRFTPTGSRVAFIGATDFNVVTVNPDGSDLRIVSNYYTDAIDAGVFDGRPIPEFAPPRPQWMGSRISWAREIVLNPPTWAIVVADDVAGATPTRYMSCPGIVPREYQVLSDGSVVVSYRTSVSDAGYASDAPENLYRLAPNSANNCTVVAQYTDLGNNGFSVATDFAVSPDGTQIAFVETNVSAGATDAGSYANADLPGGFGYVVGVDGGTPTKLSNDFLMSGPRWIGDGTRLVATRYDGYSDGGMVQVATSIIVRSPEAGAAPTPLLQADGYNSFVSAGSNGGCSVALGTPPSEASWLGLLGAGLAFVRRRSRRDEE